TYLEYVLELPWKKSAEEKLDLVEARKILDEDHFGLDDVKERILEFLAVIKLRPDSKSPIICFVGPPGVGKTSLGRSIARSLGRMPRVRPEMMDVIRLAGYSDKEKLGIARQYLVPRQIIENGLNAAQLTINDEALELLSTRYTREAGVRQLERTIGSIARKVA